MNQGDTSVYVTSIYGARERCPLVTIRIGDDAPFAISPAEASAEAANLLASAEAALSDAFVFEFMAQQVGIPANEAASMLVAFRQWREDHAPAEPA